jgi:hypothetical protein
MREHLPGSIIPDAVIDRLARAGDPKGEGKRICIELLQELTQIPAVSGAHIMAPRNHSAELPSGRRVAGGADFFIGVADTPLDPASSPLQLSAAGGPRCVDLLRAADQHRHPNVFAGDDDQDDCALHPAGRKHRPADRLGVRRDRRLHARIALDPQWASVDDPFGGLRSILRHSRRPMILRARRCCSAVSSATTL